MIGRSEQVGALVEEYRRGRPFILLHGPAGSGKTSLALEVAHRLARGRSPQFAAIVWLPTRPAILTVDGFVQSPLASGTLDSLITNIAAVIGRQDILKELPDRHPPLIHAALAERSVLLLVDDLDEVEDPRVLPFLTALPDSTGTLATARSQLATPRQERVAPLTERDSLRLINQLLESPGHAITGPEATELYQITGGIPLALVWTASLVRYGLQLTHILSAFANSSSDILQFCFQNAWRRIAGTDAVPVLGALALFSTGTSRPVLSDASGFDRGAEAFDRAVVTLSRLGLVEVFRDRLVLLPMTRSFVMDSVFGSAPDPGSAELRSQWVDALARYVNECLLAPDLEECFSRLEAERGNLEELFAWSATQPEERVLPRAAVVYHDVSYFLFSRGYWQTLTDHADWAVPALWRQGLMEDAIGVLLTWVARVRLLREETTALEECFAFAKRLIASAPAPQPILQAIYDFDLASLRQREGDDPQAAVLLEHAADEFRRAGRGEWLARTANRLGNVLSAQRQYTEARAAYEMAIEAGTEFEGTPWGREMVAIARGNRGILANREGQSERAVQYLHEVQPFIRQTMDGATLLMEMAIAEYHLGHERRAYQLGVAAQEKAQQLHLRVTLGESEPAWESSVLPALASRYGKRR